MRDVPVRKVTFIHAVGEISAYLATGVGAALVILALVAH